MTPSSPPPPSQSMETQTIPLKPEALVLGGGIVGISIAQSLSQEGIHVTLLEKGDHLGGKALELRTFYNRPEEVLKWIDEKAAEIKKNPKVKLITRAELKRVDGHIGQFKAKIRNHDGTETILSPSVIVVAMGYATNGEKRKAFGDTKGSWALRKWKNSCRKRPNPS